MARRRPALGPHRVRRPGPTAGLRGALHRRQTAEVERDVHRLQHLSRRARRLREAARRPRLRTPLSFARRQRLDRGVVQALVGRGRGLYPPRPRRHGVDAASPPMPSASASSTAPSPPPPASQTSSGTSSPAPAGSAAGVEQPPTPEKGGSCGACEVGRSAGDERGIAALMVLLAAVMPRARSQAPGQGALHARYRPGFDATQSSTRTVDRSVLQSCIVGDQGRTVLERGARDQEGRNPLSAYLAP